MLGAELGQLGGDVAPLRLKLRRGGLAPRSRRCPSAPGAADGASVGAGRACTASSSARVRCASEWAAWSCSSNAGAVGAGVGGVELHQHLAGLHAVAVLHQHALDHARLQRLQSLVRSLTTMRPGATATMSISPRIAQTTAMTKKCTDRTGQAARRRMHGRVLQAQRGRQEGRFVGQCAWPGQLVAHLPSRAKMSRLRAISATAGWDGFAATTGAVMTGRLGLRWRVIRSEQQFAARASPPASTRGAHTGHAGCGPALRGNRPRRYVPCPER